MARPKRSNYIEDSLGIEDHPVAKQAHKPVVHEPEEDTQEAPDTENESQDPEHNGHAGGKVTQADAVRQSIAAGCPTAKTGVPWIEKTFGIVMTPTGFAAAKSQIGRAKGNGSTSERQHDIKSKAPAAGMPEGLKGVGAHLRVIKGMLAKHENDADELKTMIGDVQTMIALYGVSGTNEMVDLVSEMQAE